MTAPPVGNIKVSFKDKEQNVEHEHADASERETHHAASPAATLKEPIHPTGFATCRDGTARVGKDGNHHTQVARDHGSDTADGEAVAVAITSSPFVLADARGQRGDEHGKGGNKEAAKLYSACKNALAPSRIAS